MALVRHDEKEIRDYQQKALVDVAATLADFERHVHTSFYQRAEQHAAQAREELREEMKTAEFAALDQVLSGIRVSELSVGDGTSALLESAKSTPGAPGDKELGERSPPAGMEDKTYAGTVVRMEEAKAAAVKKQMARGGGHREADGTRRRPSRRRLSPAADAAQPAGGSGGGGQGG